MMTAEERKELFRKYLEDCGKCNERNGERPNADSLDGYWFALSNKILKEKSINSFEYEDELSFENIKEEIIILDRGGDPSQGAKWYSKFLAEMKFKKLLEWFVNQIRINNEIVPGKKTSGKGYNGTNIRHLYGDYRSFKGFDLDCTVQGGYMRNIPGSNYIHLTGSWLNINPLFNSNSDVVALKIIYKPNKKVEREYPQKTVKELGLYDNNFPNETLRSFFEDYKKEINSIQKEIKVASANETGDDKVMEEYKELNLILYGPPGTGKTYNTVIRAVAIIDGENSVYTTIDGKKKLVKPYKEILNRYRVLIEQGRIAFTTFHQSYGYEEFIEGIKPDFEAEEIKYKRTDGIFKAFCDKAAEELEEHNKIVKHLTDLLIDIKDETEIDKYVFIIDEINRGNVSKIFGELITLIEPTKRLGAEEEMTCKLPYSGKAFGVPKNVYILGTMNTADRSLVQLDAALRRRFAFEEMMPKPELLKDKGFDKIELDKLLEKINERITALLDREHQIGHSYFMNVHNVNELAYVFKQKIIPLLQEYFFDDYESIQKVLSKDFIEENNNPFENGKKIYSIVAEMPTESSKYQEIYRAVSDSTDNG